MTIFVWDEEERKGVSKRGRNEEMKQGRKEVRKQERERETTSTRSFSACKQSAEVSSKSTQREMRSHAFRFVTSSYITEKGRMSGEEMMDKKMNRHSKFYAKSRINLERKNGETNNT